MQVSNSTAIALRCGRTVLIGALALILTIQLGIVLHLNWDRIMVILSGNGNITVVASYQLAGLCLACWGFCVYLKTTDKNSIWLAIGGAGTLLLMLSSAMIAFQFGPAGLWDDSGQISVSSVVVAFCIFVSAVTALSLALKLFSDFVYYIDSL